MKKILISFADEKFVPSQKICSYTGRIIARFDKIISYSPSDIDQDFIKKNREILEYRRGAGLWLWKPYFIYKTLIEMKDNDYLFYCDSGAFFIGRINQIVNSMKQDIWVSEVPLIEDQWTKPSVFRKLGIDDESVKKTNQIQASFLLIKKTEYSLNFIKKWLDLCCDISLISPEEGDGNPFIAHREDQSLLSILSKVEGIIPHRDPSQFGRFPEGYIQRGYKSNIKVYHADKYKTIIILHRHKMVTWKMFIKEILIAKGPRIIHTHFYGP